MQFMNRVWLQGRISSQPSLRDLTHRTRITSFSLDVVESWTNDRLEDKSRTNRVPVEVVGKDAERVAHEARLGRWVTLEGYIRTEQSKGETVLKVRTLSIAVWEELHDRSRLQARAQGEPAPEVP